MILDISIAMTVFKYFDTPFPQHFTPHLFLLPQRGDGRLKCHIGKKQDFPGVSRAIWAQKCNSSFELMLSFSLSFSEMPLILRSRPQSERQTIKDRLGDSDRAAGYAVFDL